jgi:hypothetical protein
LEDAGPVLVPMEGTNHFTLGINYSNQVQSSWRQTG